MQMYLPILKLSFLSQQLGRQLKPHHYFIKTKYDCILSSLLGIRQAYVRLVLSRPLNFSLVIRA